MGLKVTNLTKIYDNYTALNHVSFEIEEGKILGILGRNGAGKTTTIKSIMGIIEPDQGQITYNGQNLRNINVGIGYLPEERGLYVNARVNDQLLYFAMLNGLQKKEALEKIKQLLEEFEIPQHLNKKVKTLSKGNKQKIQLISAILHRPQIVILDEPFSGLDPVNIQLFKRTVLRLKEEGTTILFSSHRMEDVEELCDRILMLKQGNLIENDTVEGLIEKYSKKNTVTVQSGRDIRSLLKKNHLKLLNQNQLEFEIQYQRKEDLQQLYRDMLEEHVELQEIHQSKIYFKVVSVNYNTWDSRNAAFYAV